LAIELFFAGHSRHLRPAETRLGNNNTPQYVVGPVPEVTDYSVFAVQTRFFQQSRRESFFGLIQIKSPVKLNSPVDFDEIDLRQL
jgi:hypothetical protein